MCLFVTTSDLSDDSQLNTTYQESRRNIVANEVVTNVPLHQEVKYECAVVPV